MPSQIHTPVLLERTIELLEPSLTRADAVMVDCTLGMGGHSEALLEAFPNLTLIGIDRDEAALAIAKKRLEKFQGRVIFEHAVYDELESILNELEISQVDGILLDLGVSSLQLDERERGFAYSQDAPLDMRMNSSQTRTAQEALSTLSEQELRHIFQKYGEEPLAARYARAITKRRTVKEFTNSADLVDVLQEATPYAKKNLRHPAKRVFQALRIYVNEELDALESVIPQALENLKVGGRALVMSYHSLEDRMVKNFFRQYTTSKTPIGVPVEIAEHAAKYQLLLRGSEPASQEEQLSNPRSKPVRLRAVERIGE